MKKPIQVDEVIGKLAGKTFPQQRYLNETQINERIKFLEQQKRDLLGIVTRSYNVQIRGLARQREDIAQAKIEGDKCKATH